MTTPNRLSLLATAVLLVGACPAFSEPEPAFDMTPEASLRSAAESPVPAEQATAPVAPPAPPDVLRHVIPSDRLRLQGETAHTEYEVFLTEAQAGADAKLHLSFLNALVVAPEASRLRVRINETVVLNAPIDSPTRPRDLVIDIPAGVLRSGPNQLAIDASQRHRTDCSIESTYELWTDVDPAQTYLAFPGRNTPQLSGLDDLAATGVDAEGDTIIRLIGRADHGVEAGPLGAELVQTLAVALRTPNPVVEFAAGPSEPGPGVIDVVLAPADALPEVAASLREDAARGPVAVVLPGTDRANLLVVSGPSQAALKDAVAAVAQVLARYRTPADRVPARADRPRLTPMLEGAGSVALEDVGLPTMSFSGRRWVSAFEIGLPSDFYASSYGEAVLELNAAFSREVTPGSQIEVFVNGRIASVTPILRTGDDLHDTRIKVPMTQFRPGVNRIELTAALRTQADDACLPGTVTVATESRMLVSGDSRFVMPGFARLSEAPNLGAFVNQAMPLAGSGPAQLVVGPSQEAMAAGLTAIARLSATSGQVIEFESVSSASPSPGKNALLVGAFGALPRNSLERVGLLEPYAGEIDTVDQQGSAVQATLQRWREIDTSSLAGRVQRGVADLLNLGPHSLGLFLPSDAPYAARVSDQAVLAQSVQPEGGIWTMLMVPEADRLVAGVAAFTRADIWTAATGRVAVLAESDGPIESLAASRVRYMATAPLDVQNMRLVAANWLSRHVLAYALGLGVVLLLLSVATWRVLRSFGRPE